MTKALNLYYFRSKYVGKEVRYRSFKSGVNKCKFRVKYITIKDQWPYKYNKTRVIIN
jgi:hypothetical protein